MLSQFFDGLSGVAHSLGDLGHFRSGFVDDFPPLGGELARFAGNIHGFARTVGNVIDADGHFLDRGSHRGGRLALGR